MAEDLYASAYDTGVSSVGVQGVWLEVTSQSDLSQACDWYSHAGRLMSRAVQQRCIHVQLRCRSIDLDLSEVKDVYEVTSGMRRSRTRTHQRVLTYCSISLVDRRLIRSAA